MRSCIAGCKPPGKPPAIACVRILSSSLFHGCSQPVSDYLLFITGLRNQKRFCHRHTHNSVVGEETSLVKQLKILGLYIVKFVDAAYDISYNCSQHSPVLISCHLIHVNNEVCFLCPYNNISDLRRGRLRDDKLEIVVFIVIIVIIVVAKDISTVRHSFTSFIVQKVLQKVKL